jgi:hypothetical protein
MLTGRFLRHSVVGPKTFSKRPFHTELALRQWRGLPPVWLRNFVVSGPADKTFNVFQGIDGGACSQCKLVSIPCSVRLSGILSEYEYFWLARWPTYRL